MVKVTFTLDEETVARLADASQRLSKPKSQVVREAVLNYHVGMDRLSEEERRRILRVLDGHLARPPQRSRAGVDKELMDLRAARRRGGRRTPLE